MRPYLALTKPRITWLILVATAIGFFFGLPGGSSGLLVGLLSLRFLHALVGTGLLASGTAALNQWMEREADAKMRRTAARPIPAGALSARRALLFGVAISIAGFVELASGTNTTAAWLGVFTLVAYLFVYTPLKARSWLSTAVGAVPGAMPPVIGFVAAGGTAISHAAVLFAILFLWQFPHFYAIAWMYREDYARAGIRMLPVIEPDGRSTARQMLLACSALIPASLLPAAVGMDGRLYAAGALALGLWFLYSNVRIAVAGSRAHARAVLIASVVYLPLLYGLLALDRRW